MNHLWDSSQYVKTSDLQATVADDLIEDLEIKPEEDVLDVGCGLGNITMNIASIACKGHVLGVDASPSMIEQAKENLLLHRLGNIRYQIMSATELQCNCQFDVVFSNSALHWVPQQEVALRSMHRCLKAKGRIGLQFPLIDSSHPMVKLVHETIHQLRLDEKYATWLSPWYVPESADSYVNLLEKIS